MMKLISLTLHNFQGVSDREILMDGNDVDVFGANAAGKTTNFDAFTWDLWGKDSKNNKLDKDIKFKGDVDHGLEHTVTAVLELDSGKHISLKRIFAENWTKKKGSAVATFSGHTTNFEIDGVPVKEKEYQAQINEIIDENKFKMLTDPLFFQNQLHWQDRRKLLIEVCGDVKDADVIASSPELQDLLKLMGDHSMDNYRKMLMARKTKLNDELKKIPVRIDEAQRNMPEVTGLNEEVLQTEINSLKTQQMEANRKIVKIQNGSAVAEKEKEIAELDAKQIRIKSKYDCEINRKALEDASVLSELKQKKSRLQNNITDKQKRIDMMQKLITSGGEYVQKLRDDWNIENAKPFDVLISDTCPTCGQHLSEDKLEEAKEKALEAFNLAKSAVLTKITNQGKEAAKKIEEDGKQLESLQTDVETDTKKIADIDAESQTLETALAAVADYKTDEEYIASEQRKEQIKAEIVDLGTGNQQEVQQIKSEIRAIDTDIQVRQEKLANIATRKTTEQRIEELKEQQKKLVVEFEDLEHHLYLTDLFVQNKVSMLDEKINSKFKIAQFRLFEMQVNGGLSECCDVLYNGVGRMSSSEEIKAGLDIIQTLSEFYGIQTPIFIDNCESITDLPTMEAQIIRLVVSAEDKELRIVIKNKEQAAA
jgi:DNA repair exonuclease SbcCD ATPase subunit